MHPYSYDEVNPPERDLKIFQRLGARLRVDNDYRFGAVWDVYTKCNGDANDWSYAGAGHEPIYSYALEIGTMQVGHWAPRNLVPELVAENIETCLSLIEFADEPARALPPEPTQNLTAESDWRGRTVLRWDADEDEINPPVSFQIDRKVEDNDWEICQQNIDTTLWISEPFRDSESILYRICAFDAEGDTSDWSEECRVVMPDYDDRIEIPLRSGWNLVSLNIGLPKRYWTDSDGFILDSLFVGLTDGESPVVRFLKDRHGRFWIPGVVQNIPEWKPLESYWILADIDTVIELSGIRIPSDEAILLSAGWNAVTFLPDIEMEVNTPDFQPVASIIDHLEVIKEGFGSFALPRINYSGITAMRHGRGYLIRVDADCELRYPGE